MKERLLHVKIQSKKIYLPNIGLVLFEKSQRAKHINISIKPPSVIRVAIPKGISFERAKKFAQTKEIWIKRTLNKVQQHLNSSIKLNPVEKNNAKIYLIRRLEEIAQEHGFIYNNATVRNQKTRWGSCSGKNNLSLNIQLINLPHELIDYVIFHELIHTKVKNHSPVFWKKLDELVGNAKSLNKELKQYILC